MKIATRKENQKKRKLIVRVLWQSRYLPLEQKASEKARIISRVPRSYFKNNTSVSTDWRKYKAG